MDKQMQSTSDKSTIYNQLNQQLIEDAILLKATSELKAVRLGIVPEMEVVNRVHIIEPNYNAVQFKQIVGRMFREKDTR